MENFNDWIDNSNDSENLKDILNIFQKIINNNQDFCKKISKTQQPSNHNITRQKVINHDDIINLKILLEQTKSIEDFIKNI